MQNIPYITDTSNTAYLHKDKLLVNGKTNELDFLRENFHMETGQEQDMVTRACAGNAEMSHHSTHLQNRETREEEKRGRENMSQR
jgi:hypothetical protein